MVQLNRSLVSIAVWLKYCYMLHTTLTMEFVAGADAKLNGLGIGKVYVL